MDRPLAITLRSVAHRTQTQAPKKERPGHTSVYALHSALTQCAQGVEGDVTLRLEVWQLRQDWVVRLRLRLRWSMSMEKSRSRRSPFMTVCVVVDSANMVGTSVGQLGRGTRYARFALLTVAMSG